MSPVLNIGRTQNESAIGFDTTRRRLDRWPKQRIIADVLLLQPLPPICRSADVGSSLANMFSIIVILHRKQHRHNEPRASISASILPHWLMSRLHWNPSVNHSDVSLIPTILSEFSSASAYESNFRATSSRCVTVAPTTHMDDKLPSIIQCV